VTTSAFWLDTAVYGLVTVVAMSLLLAVLGAGVRRRVNLSFILLMIDVAVWAAASVTLRVMLLLETGTQQFWMELSTFAFALIGPSLLAFVGLYTQTGSRWPYVSAGVVLLLTVLLGIPLFGHRVVSGVRLGASGIVAWDRALWAEFVAAPLYVGAALVLVLLWKERKRLAEPHLAIGIAILIGSGLLFSIVALPIPTLSLAAAASVTLMGYAVLNRQLFNPLRELTAHLEELRAFNESIVQSMEGGILLEDGTGHIRFVNARLAELLGCTPGELLGQPWTVILALPDAARAAERVTERPEDIAGRFEVTLTTREGRPVPAIMSSRPLFERGRLVGILSVLTDVTELKQAEELLQRERETFFSILQKAPYGVILIDKDENCQYVNPEFTRITGCALEDIPTVEDWFRRAYPDPDYRREVVERWKGDTAQRISRVFSLLCEDGEVREVEFRPTLLDDGRAILVLMDISERRRGQAERERLLADLRQRSTQLLTAAEVSKWASTILDPEELVDQAVKLIQERFALYYVGLFLVDGTGEYALLRAGTGEAGRKMLEAGHRLSVGGESMVGRSIVSAKARIALDVGKEAVHFDNPHLPDTRSEAALPLVSRGACIGALAVQSVEETAFSEEDVAVLQTMADHLAIAIENARLYEAAQQEISKRRQIQEALERRTQELALVNRATRALISTLDLDQVLTIVLEEARRVMNVVACSVWLIDAETDELICRQATGPKGDVVRSWRLAPGEGIAGWVAYSGESLIVPDARADERHFAALDQQTGLPLRSILTVPLQVKDRVIGVLQVVDSEVDRFGTADLALLEPLAATASMAIENARLYEQARQDAETKSVLLQEANHRVKNNLSAIIGLLYAARRQTGADGATVYRSVIRDLINQVQGLVTVHGLLSASNWAPLLLDELAREVIRASLRTLAHDKTITVEVSPSPVRVTADQAHNLTLVINELTTNTVKHALHKRDTTRITVRIGHVGDWVRLEFRDDGPSYPAEVLGMGGGSIGLDLVRNIVRKNLGGEVFLQNDHGAVAIVRFRAKVMTWEEASE
jgi:PAS domain S-box-containing protein